MLIGIPACQVQAQLRNDASAATTIDDCIQLWTKGLIADAARADRVAENVTAMQHECVAMLEVLAQYLETLDHAAQPDNRPRRERERASALDSSSSHFRRDPQERFAFPGPSFWKCRRAPNTQQRS